MYKHLLSLVVLMLLVSQLFGQSTLRSDFRGIALFETQVEPLGSGTVKEGILLSVRQKVLNEIIAEQPTQFKLLLPAPDGSETWTVLLEKNYLLSDDIIIRTSDGGSMTKAQVLNKAVHYKGRIEGESESLVALSFFEHEVMGVLSSSKSNYDLGILNGDAMGRYVLYNANEIYPKLPFNCTPPEFKYGSDDGAEQRVGNLTCSRAGFRVYYECDYQMYLDRSSNANNVVNYVTGLHNVVNVLYNNEDLSSTISEIFVWTSADPYRTITSSSTYLTNFRNTRTSFNGDLAHLLSTRNTNLGGIAYVDVLCNKPVSYAFSNISNNFQQFPTYSWSVMVVTHEIGHNLGSPHTQSCSWPGGAIDNCYPTEGGCALGPAPVNGGTIMSYCHLTANGINFNNGFGPLPGNLIRNRTQNAHCLALSSGSQTISLGCIPTTTNPLNATGIGPRQVQLNDIDFASAASNIGVFTDYSCTVGDTLNEGSTYTIRVLTSGSNRQNVRAYIDYNGDDTFAAGELILSSNGATTGDVWHQATFTVPTTALKNTPLRMRVLSEFFATSNPQPCGTLPYGQAEDYALFIVGGASITTGNIATSSVCSGSNVSVPFTASGTFNSDNVFTAQLSNSSGNFGAPVDIGTLTGTSSGSILATIPIGTTSGSGYRIRVVSSNPSVIGTLSETTLTITNSVTPSISIAITGAASSTICAGTTVGFSATTVNGGSSPTYQWKINGNNVGTNSPNFSTNTLTNGQTVSCVLSSNAVCASPATASSNHISMTVNAIPTATITGAGTICSGVSTTLTASGGSSYLWNTGATTSAITVSPSSTTSYSVTVNSAAGCTAQAAATITVNPTITPTFADIPAFCSGSLAPTLPAVSNNGIFGTWSPATVNNNSSGIYTFTPAAGQCANLGSLSISVLPKPITSISGNGFICQGQSTTLTAGGGVLYSWSTGEQTASITVSPSETSLYSVTAQNSEGCSATAELSVQVSSGSEAAPATPGIIDGSSTVCDGTVGAIYSIAPVPGAVSYHWEISNGTIVSGQGSTTVSINLPELFSSMTLKVQAINECGTAGNFRSLLIRAPAKSTTPTTINGPSNVCGGANDILFSIAPTANAVSYNWVVSNGQINALGDGTQALAAFNQGYTTAVVEVRSVNICGITSGARKLSIKPPAATIPGLINGKNQVCQGTLGEMYSIEPVPGAVSYFWQNSAGGIIGPNNGTSVSVNFTTTYTTTTLSVQSINICGTLSAARTLIIRPPVNAPVPGPISGNLAACRGTIGEVYSILPVPGAVQYQWETTTGSFTGPTNGTSVQLNLPGNYTSAVLRAYSVNACGAKSAARSITLRPPASIKPGNISGPSDAVCNGTTNITYSITPVADAVSYQWVNTNGTIISGQGTSSILLNAPDNYTSFNLRVQSINTCGVASTFSDVLTIRSVPSIPASITGPTDICAGASVSYTSATSIGATGYQWTMPTGWTLLSGQGTQTVQVLTGNSNGSIRVAGTNLCGNSNGRGRIISIIPCLQQEPEVLDAPKEMNLRIFPNPAHNKITILGKDISEVHLMDIKGSMLQAKRYQAEQRIELNLPYPSGMYLIRVSGEGWSEIRKILIQQ
jgi:hypothetical protein